MTCLPELFSGGDRRMTTNEVCEALGCDRVTLMRNWREIETCSAPEQVKKIENGRLR